MPLTLLSGTLAMFTVSIEAKREPKASGSASQTLAVLSTVIPLKAGWSSSAFSTPGERDATLASEMFCRVKKLDFWRCSRKDLPSTCQAGSGCSPRQWWGLLRPRSKVILPPPSIFDRPTKKISQTLVMWFPRLRPYLHYRVHVC